MTTLFFLVRLGRKTSDIYTFLTNKDFTVTRWAPDILYVCVTLPICIKSFHMPLRDKKGMGFLIYTLLVRENENEREQVVKF